jgi:hypothetical protein
VIISIKETQIVFLLLLDDVTKSMTLTAWYKDHTLSTYPGCPPSLVIRAVCSRTSALFSGHLQADRRLKVQEGQRKIALA